MVLSRAGPPWGPGLGPRHRLPTSCVQTRLLPEADPMWKPGWGTGGQPSTPLLPFHGQVVPPGQVVRVRLDEEPLAARWAALGTDSV